MENYKQFIGQDSKIFESHEIEGWEPIHIVEGERIYNELMAIYEAEGAEGLQNVDEGLLGKILGGVAGFVIGPSIGKVIAKALGIERGLLYDMFTSRLVGAALGTAISKNIGN